MKDDPMQRHDDLFHLGKACQQLGMFHESNTIWEFLFFKSDFNEVFVVGPTPFYDLAGLDNGGVQFRVPMPQILDSIAFMFARDCERVKRRDRTKATKAPLTTAQKELLGEFMENYKGGPTAFKRGAK